MGTLRLLLVLMIASVAAPAVGGSAGAVASSALDAQGRVKRLLVDYYLTTREDGSLLPTVRNIEAFDGVHQATESIHHAARDKPPWLDPDRRIVWTGPAGTTTYNVFARVVNVSDPVAEASVAVSPFLDCIGWRPAPPKGAAAPPRGSIALVDVLGAAGPNGVEVATERETVDGRVCVGLSVAGGRDRLWVCPALGHAIVKRLVRLAEDGPDVEYHCGEFTEVARGTWLPRTCTGEFRWADGPIRHRWFRIDVEHLAVNEGVPDDHFRPQFAPGTLVYDKGRTLIGKIDGGAELLDLWAAACLISAPKPRAPISTQSLYTPALLAGVVLAGWGIWLARDSATSLRRDDVQAPAPLSESERGP